MQFNKPMAISDNDISKILNGVQKMIDFSFKELEDKISHLPTKEEFYGKMDEVMGELQTARDETTLLTHRVSIHSDQIQKLENIHPNYSHT